jgi:hypothetical protein
LAICESCGIVAVTLSEPSFLKNLEKKSNFDTHSLRSGRDGLDTGLGGQNKQQNFLSDGKNINENP